LAPFGADLYAQARVATPPLPRYPQIKQQFNERLSQASTNEQRLDLYRKVVAQGRYSGRPMLQHMFGNFKPDVFKLDPSTPGLSDLVRLLASDNRNVVKGNARTLRYAMSIEGDGRFKVLGVNQPRTTPLGKTDADIVFRHRSTGLQVRMEVKNLSPASQLANLKDIKLQIRKMAEDARRTGEIQVWANRQKVLPEVRAYAKRYGIRIEEGLRTGKKPGDRSFRDFANDLDKKLHAQPRFTALAGGVNAGAGAYLAFEALRQLKGDLSSFEGTQGDWLRIGEHGSVLLAGTGFFTAGGSQVLRQIPTVANRPWIVTSTKWGGRIGIAADCMAEGFVVGQYLSGYLDKRQFWRNQASMGGKMVGSAVGGTAGAWAGAKIGAPFGASVGFACAPGPGAGIGAAIGGFIGGVVGGIAGGLAGANVAVSAVENLYQLGDREQHEKYVEFLLRHYQSP